MLMEIRQKPITRQGKRVAPVVFHANCLEEVCGACTMLVNGRVRQGCSALAENLPNPTTIEPMSKFPTSSAICGSIDTIVDVREPQEGAHLDSNRWELRPRRRPSS